jgi:hypothetical protein
MKKILLLALALVLVLGTLAGCGKKDDTPSGGTSTSGTSSTTTPSGTTSTTTPDEGERLVSKVGDSASYGTYNGEAIEWQTLAVDLVANKALLISKDVIAMMQYNDIHGQEVTWETASLRTWLNSDFYNAAFTDEQKAIILETALSTPANSEYQTPGGNDTVDKVFLLSEAEVNQYFANDEAMVAKYNGDTVAWWTRTPGDKLLNVVHVYADRHGGLYMMGNTADNENNSCGVRPAIWVDITPKTDSTTP